MIPRLKELYKKEIQPDLKSKFGLKNTYMAPRLSKIVLNMGLGVDGNDSKILKTCEEDLAKISGQKPVVTKFKKSISNFKTRKDTKAGLKVTLRKDKMYEFVDRLVNIAIPRPLFIFGKLSALENILLPGLDILSITFITGLPELYFKLISKIDLLFASSIIL